MHPRSSPPDSSFPPGTIPFPVKKVSVVTEAPNGSVTFTSGDHVITTPLTPEERTGFVRAAQAQMESVSSNNKFNKAAAIGSTLLSFSALMLMVIGGLAAVRKSARGDE